MDQEENESEREHPYISESGKFKKGNPGRPKGHNNITMRVKDSIADFIENNIPEIQRNFDQLKPREKLQFMVALLPYVIPKLQNIEGELNQNHTGGITITWTDPKLPDTHDKGGSGILPSIPEGVQDNSEPGGD